MTGNNLILFPTDLSDLSLKALPWVKQVASSMDARVRCLYVVDLPHLYGSLDLTSIAAPAAEDIQAQAEKRLQEYIDSRLRVLEDRIEGLVLVGRPADTIVDHAAESGARMIVMTTHGYSGVKHALLGSTTEAVLRRAPCPVLSVRSID